MSAVSLTIKALLADNPVKAVTSTHIYPFPIPLGTALPAIAVGMSGEDDQYTLSGANQFPESSVQIHCIAAKAKDAIELGEKVKSALQDLHYTTGGADAWWSKEPLDFTDFADDQLTYRRVMSFAVRWR